MKRGDVVCASCQAAGVEHIKQTVPQREADGTLAFGTHLVKKRQATRCHSKNRDFIASRVAREQPAPVAAEDQASLISQTRARASAARGESSSQRHGAVGGSLKGEHAVPCNSVVHGVNRSGICRTALCKNDSRQQCQRQNYMR